MVGTYLIEVAYKKGVVDAFAKGLAINLRHLHLASVKHVEVAQLYKLIGDVTETDRKRIGCDLLCDPIVQDYKEELESPSLLLPLPASGARDSLKGSSKIPPRPLRGEGAGRVVVVDVWYKSGVTDVVGASVQKGIQDLQIENVEAVRTGTRYRFWGLRNIAEADHVARALLFNPLVHERVIHVN